MTPSSLFPNQERELDLAVADFRARPLLATRDRILRCCDGLLESELMHLRATASAAAGTEPPPPDCALFVVMQDVQLVTYRCEQCRVISKRAQHHQPPKCFRVDPQPFHRF